MIPSIVFAIVLLVLECLPNGIEMKFVWPVDENSEVFASKLEYYPYFSDMPFGYGNFVPILIGIFTISAIILCIVNAFLDKKALDIAIVVLNLLKFALSAIEFIFSRTAINWAVFAIALVFSIYSVIELIDRIKEEKYKAQTTIGKNDTVDCSDKD